MKKNKILLLVNFIIIISLIVSVLILVNRNNDLKKDIISINKENRNAEFQETYKVICHYVDLINKIERISNDKSNMIAHKDETFRKNEYDRYFEVAEILEHYKIFYKEYAYKGYYNKHDEFSSIINEIYDTLDKLESYYLYEGSRMKFDDVSYSDIKIAYKDFQKSLNNVNEMYSKLKNNFIVK